MKLVKWEITRPQGAFVDFDELIYSIQDIGRDDDFKTKINDYYISKQNNEHTNFIPELWVHAYLKKTNTNDIIQYMDEKLNTKLIDIQNDPKAEDETQIVKPDYSTNESDNTDFRKFLHDNTLICFDLHQNNLPLAKTTASFVKSRIRSNDPQDAEFFLHNHFKDNSEHYRKIISENREDRFWECFSKNYNGCTSWDHFYYNLILS